MNHDLVKKKIETDPDYIYSKRFGNSLAACVERYPEGASTKLIAQVLLMTEEEVENIYLSVIEKLRDIMKIET